MQKSCLEVTQINKISCPIPFHFFPRVSKLYFKHLALAYSLLAFKLIAWFFFVFLFFFLGGGA